MAQRPAHLLGHRGHLRRPNGLGHLTQDGPHGRPGRAAAFQRLAHLHDRVRHSDPTGRYRPINPTGISENSFAYWAREGSTCHLSGIF